MAGAKKDDDSEPKSGQLIRGAAPLPLGPAGTPKGRTVDWLLSRLSRWPFRNRAYIQALDTAHEVIGKQDKLEELLIKHSRTRRSLNDLGTILAQDDLQRQRELLEEQRRLTNVLNDFMLEGEMMDSTNKLKTEELKIRQMELAKRKAQLKKELEELTKAPPEPEPPKKPTTRGRSPKQKRREDALKRYEKEITRIEGMKATAKVKATLTKAATNELEEELEKIEKMP